MGYPASNGNSEGIAYTPDPLGRPTQIGGYASGISYFPNGAVAGFNYGSGASYVAQQNARQLVQNFSFGVGGTLHVSEDLGYDGDGNITNVTDLVNGQRTKAFGYDALNRLTSATANGLYGAETYAYDALNNLRSRLTAGNTLTLNYNANNQLASVSQGGSTAKMYGYDPQGNRNSLTAGSNTTSYTFDALNQLQQVSGLGSYAYDAFGRRVTKTTNAGASTYYFYNQDNQLIYSFDPSAATATNYIYLGTKLIAKHALPALSVPNAPTFSSNPNLGNFSVSWNSVPGATSYTLQQDGTTVYSGSATTYSVTGLLPDSHEYNVQACSSGGCSAWSSGGYVVVLPPIPVITVPTGTFNGLYTVSWTASPSTQSYTLQESFNGGSWATVASNLASTSFSRPGTTTGSYTYRVEAINYYGQTAGWSVVSNPVTVNTSYGVTPTPAPALSIPGTNNTGTQTITWSASSPVTSYTLQESTTTGTGTTAWSTVYSGTATSVTLTNLGGSTGRGTYNFQVNACNAIGGGSACTGWSAQQTLVVTIPPHSAPTLSVPAGLITTSPYTVSWTSVPTATTYNLQQQANGGSWATVQATAAMSWSISGQSDGSYAYQVQACNGSQCGPWSGTGTVTVDYPPGSAPSLSGGGTSSTGSYSLSWSAVAGATSYNLWQSTNGGSAWTSVQSSGATSWSVNGQGNGSYIYMVNACDAGGCSGWSNQVTETVSLVPPTPTLTLSFTASTNTKPVAKASWTAVATATSYNLQLQNPAGSTASTSTVYSGANTSWSQLFITQVPLTLAFRVQACNSTGCSAWTSWQNVTLP